MKLLLILLQAVLLVGCATNNPLAQFYQDHTKNWPVALQQRLIPSSVPRIISSSNLNEDGRRLEEQGLAAIGVAAFSGRSISQSQLLAQARKLKAEVVLFNSEFSHSEQGVLPLLSYQPGQTSTTRSYGTATAHAYGSGGHAYGSGSYSGSSTTTTPGTFRTENIPYQRQVFDQDAVFFQRMKPGILGANLDSIPDELRSKLQRNTGVFVKTVTQDGPAFKANVLRGDIIIQMADKPVLSVQEFDDLLTAFSGQKVAIKVIRGNQTLDMDVQLRESQ